MSRRSRYDEDARRLPEGMKRVGYNANTQRYTFKDQKDRTFWEGPEGSRFGKLTQISADQVDTDEPLDLSTKNFAPQSSFPSPTTNVADVPPATDFEDILQDVMRERARSNAERDRARSDASTLSMGSQKLSQSWQSALRFASATSKLVLGPKRAADEKPLLKEVEKRVEERLKSENGYGAKS